MDDLLKGIGNAVLEPKFMMSMGLIILISAFSGAATRMRSAGHKADSITARLGLVLHWTALFIAVLLFGGGAAIIALLPSQNENTIFVIGALWVGALVIWLMGKAARFVLTGPLPSSSNHQLK